MQNLRILGCLTLDLARRPSKTLSLPMRWSLLVVAVVAMTCELRIDRHFHRRVALHATGLIFDGDINEFPNSTTRLLCRVGFDTMMNRSAHALVTFATTMRYLSRGIRRKKGERLEFWAAFVAKALYADEKGIDMYLGIGDDDDPGCRRSSHFLKIPTVLAVLDLSYESATYVDLDVVPRSQNTPEDYLTLGGDIIASSNVNNVPIIVNAGVFIARNSKTARDILTDWYSRRCGETRKDQLALWTSLFHHWGILNGSSLFDDYDVAHARALPVLVDAYVDAQYPRQRSQCQTRCQRIFRSLGCLVEPLQIRDVTLVPVVPFGHLPPLQAEAPHPGWWCHKKCPTPQRRRLLDEASCVENRQFLCPCGRVLPELSACNDDDVDGCIANALADLHLDPRRHRISPHVLRRQFHLKADRKKNNLGQ